MAGEERRRLRAADGAAVVLLAAYVAGLGLLGHAALTTPPATATAYAVPAAPFSAYADPRAWWPVALQLALGLGAFAAYYLPRRHETRSFSLLVTGVLGASTILLGLLGAWPCAPGESAFFAPLTSALGLLVGALPTPDGLCRGRPYSLALQVGRLLGPLLLVLTAVGIVATLFRAQLDRLAVRLARSLVVVVGLGEDVLPLVRRLAADRPAGTTLTVLVEAGDDGLTRLVRTLGARVVLADREDARALRTLLVRRGRFKVAALHVVSANGSANLAWAHRLRAVADAAGADGIDVPPLITVRLDDPWQAEYWRRTNAYRTPPRTEAGAVRWVSDALSAYEVTASTLVAAAQRERLDRIAVVGASPLALAVCAELAQRQREAAVLHTPHPRPTIADLVLVGPDAEELREQHRVRQERFGNVAHARRIAVAPVVPTATELGRVLAGPAGNAVILAHEPGDRGGGASPSLLAALHPTWTIYYADPSARGLAARPVMKRLHPFGLTVEPEPGEAVGSWERAARVVHRAYLEGLERPDPVARPAQRPWEELSAFYRESNTRLITATLAGAESVGRTWGPEPEPEPGSGPATTAVAPGQLVAMAEFEHAAWRQFYLDAGWRYGAERDDRRRVHNALLPWAELSPGYRERAIGSVRTALSTLHALGYRSWLVDAHRPWTRVIRRGEVHATLLDQPWRWRNGSGEWLQAQAGDYRVTNGTGPGWSVEPEIFLRTHEHLGGDRWRRTGEAWAQRAVAGELVVSLEGPATAAAGDWVVKGATGEQWVTSGEHFAASYAPVRG